MRLRPLLSALIFTLSIYTVNAKTTSKVDRQREIIASLERQINKGEQEVSKLRKDKSTTQQRVQALARQVDARNGLIAAQNDQIKLLTTEIKEVQKRQDSLGSGLAMERKIYANMVREAYRNYHSNNILSYIFTSENFVEATSKIIALRSASTLREQKMQQIKNLSQNVSRHKQLLIERKAALDKTLKDLKLQKSRLERDVNYARNSIKTMSAKEKKLLSQSQLNRQNLEKAISELRKLTKGNKSGDTFSSKTSNLNLPVVGGQVKRYLDNMAEIKGSANAKVISIYEGKVVDIKTNRITGKYDIYIAHGEYITSYAGLASASVSKGSTVKRNQAIGVIGQSVDIMTMQSEYKMIFGIYAPNPKTKLKASECFKRK
ncbi:MAG: peptidoglycan DD-metalloendopeptidase family protein [Rikenellaceae bacterium]